MKIKIYKYIIPLFAGSLIWTACDDELNKLPPQSLPTELALATNENVLQALNGAYNALSFTDLLGGEIMRNSELLAANNEVVFSGTFGAPNEIWRKEMTTINADVREIWLDGYDAINIANSVLSALDVVDQVNRNKVEGEAKFIRGVLYFELVKVFGKPFSDGNAASNLGVPIITTGTTTIDASSEVSRNTVMEAYTQAISDLSDAAVNLPAFNGDFANSVAANAVLARIYLQMGDYSNALSRADQAITGAAGNYTMTNLFSDAFNRNSNSTEDIFSIQVSATDGANAMHTYYAPQALGGRGDIEIQQRHLDYYNPADVRLGFFYLDPTTGETRTGKWQNEFGNTGVIRLAEMYLIRAEANVRLGTTTGDTPANDLDRTRSRAGLGFLASPTLNDVLLERKLELAHEGQAIHDFKRTQGNYYRLVPAFGAVDASGAATVDGFAYDDDKLVYPIPDREINANPNLTQNPGYGN